MLVTGIGQCSLDYLGIVDSFPEVDTKKEVSEWIVQGGGPVATALVALTRLGLNCRFHGITCDDFEGEKIRDSLVNEGIDIKGVLVRKGCRSQLAFIAIEKETAKRTIFWKRQTGKVLGSGELDNDFLKDASFLHLDGLMTEVSLYAAKKAKSLDIPVMLDGGRVREGMIELAGLCEYVVVSEEFAKDLGWRGDSEEFKKEIAVLGKGVVTVTLGARGSVTYFNNEIIEIPSYRVEAVDTTGAGDVFHGGYIYGVLKGWDIYKTLKFASAFAALKCRKIGGRAGIPGLSEVSGFLDEADNK